MGKNHSKDQDETLKAALMMITGIHRNKKIADDDKQKTVIILLKVIEIKEIYFLSEIKNLASIISNLDEYGGSELAERFLNHPELYPLSKIYNLASIISNLLKYGGKELVETLFDLSEASLEALRFYNPSPFILHLLQSGGKELVQKFLNLGSKKLAELNKLNYTESIIEYFLKSGEKELVEIFINLPLKSLEVLNKINSMNGLKKINSIKLIINNLHESGKKELVEKFLNLDPKKLAELGKIEHNYSIIADLLKSGGKELVEKFFNLDLEKLAELSKIEHNYSIISNLLQYGGKELVEKFFNLDLERLKKLSEFKDLWKIINKSGEKELVEIFMNLPLKSLDGLSKIDSITLIIKNLLRCGGNELVEKFLNFDLNRLEKLSKFTLLHEIIENLNKSGRKELVEKFLNFDLKRLEFLPDLYDNSNLLHDSSYKIRLLIEFISSDYHEFFKTLLLQRCIKDKKKLVSNFLIHCCNFNPEGKIDYIFKFIKKNKDNKRNLNIFPFILGNIEFFKDDEISDIITIENLDNIINQLTKDNFKTFFDKEKIKNYIKKSPIFELIKHNINYNESALIDNLIEIYLNELFNEQEFKDKKNTTILDKSLKNLIKASGILEEHLNNLIFESYRLTLLNTLKNFKDPYLSNFISDAINDRTTLDMIQRDINKYLEVYTESNNHKKSKNFIQNIIATILFSPFILNIKLTIPKEIQSLEFNEFLEKIVSPIFKEAGINSPEDLLNFICEIENLNEEDKINLINNTEIISYLGKIFDLFKQETNMDVDSTQQVLINNKKIENQI